MADCWARRGDGLAMVGGGWRAGRCPRCHHGGHAERPVRRPVLGAELGRVPGPIGGPRPFPLKDVVLFGAALWVLLGTIREIAAARGLPHIGNKPDCSLSWLQAHNSIIPSVKLLERRRANNGGCGPPICTCVLSGLRQDSVIAVKRVSGPRNHRQLTPRCPGTGKSLFAVAAEHQDRGQIAVELRLEDVAAGRWPQVQTRRTRQAYSGSQSGLLMRSPYDENMMLKLTLILSASLRFASTECCSQEGKTRRVPLLTFTTT